MNAVVQACLPTLTFFIPYTMILLLYLIRSWCKRLRRDQSQQDYSRNIPSRPVVGGTAIAAPRPLPLRDDAVIVFETYNVEKFKEEAGAGNCAICLEEYNYGQTLAVISPCNHRFHPACIKAWLHHKKYTCPLCRTHVLLANQSTPREDVTLDQLTLGRYSD